MVSIMLNAGVFNWSAVTEKSFSKWEIVWNLFIENLAEFLGNEVKITA